MIKKRDLPEGRPLFQRMKGKFLLCYSLVSITSDIQVRVQYYTAAQRFRRTSGGAGILKRTMNFAMMKQGIQRP